LKHFETDIETFLVQSNTMQQLCVHGGILRFISILRLLQYVVIV